VDETLTRRPRTHIALGRRAVQAVRTLRSPGSGLLGQGARFALSGGTVALVYLTSTTLLADVVGLPFELALIIGFCVGTAVHYTLQRFFVWVHHEDFALPFHSQIRRYLLYAFAQYGVTAASVAWMPALVGEPTEVVYLATAATAIGVSFLVFRQRIFHAKTADADVL
jgi:putative flippase GtrA